MRYQITHIKRFNKTDSINILDKWLIGIAVLAPALTIPQIFKIFYYQNAAGVSVISWAMFAILDIPWILYGLAHKNTQVLVAYVLWFIVNITVTIGAILYS